MQWRVIDEKPYGAAMNMAIDHAIVQGVAYGKQPPTVRFYRWKKPSVSLGLYQSPEDVNLSECRRRGVEIVRRMTGGRAVFHEKTDFTYSVVAPLSEFDSSLRGAYASICSRLIIALKLMGIQSSLSNINNIFVRGKKISGNAARLMGNSVYLQHGTLIYDLDFSTMPKILNIPRKLAEERITSILQNKRMPRREAYGALRSSMAFAEVAEEKDLSVYELELARTLAGNEYAARRLNNPMLKSRGACYTLRS